MWRGWHGFQAKRGDMSGIVLRVLADKPMHGYEIIQELERKSHGFWRPSPGSIYPTLQLLEEQDLVASGDDAGKKIYTITDAGRSEAEKSGTKTPWEHNGGDHNFEQMMEVRGVIMGLVGAMKQIMRHGTAEQQEKAIQVAKETLTKLEAIYDTK